MPTQVKVLVGTKKAGFIYTSDEKRQKWEVSDPILPGWSFYHMSADTRDGTPATTRRRTTGPGALRRQEHGRREDVGLPQREPGVPARDEGIQRDDPAPLPASPGTGTTHRQASSATSGTSARTRQRAGVVYAGTQPAGLFRSEDWGQIVEAGGGINRHENRKYWNGTGGGDSCIHSIHVHPDDPKRIFLCVGAGGSYEVEGWRRDLGAVHAERDRHEHEGTKIMAELVQEMPEALPPGRRTRRHRRAAPDADGPEEPGPHLGAGAHGRVPVGRAGDTWADVTEGLPSFHGFPIAVTKQRTGRRLRGAAGLRAGQLPGRAEAVRRLSDAGLGEDLGADDERACRGRTITRACTARGWTRTGSTPRASTSAPATARCITAADRGESWTRLPGTLPPIRSVTAAVV